MIELKQIYQRFFRMGLLVAIIIPSILLSQDPPEEFQFSQSTLQAFYFFTDITLNDEPIELDDWVAAFKGGLCVGARQWDTSGFCSDPTYSDKTSCEAAGICSDPQFNNNESDCTDENGTWSGENWTWNQCNGGVCDVPAMGLDGSTYTEGYMEIGDVPTFKIYDASSGNIFDATPSVEVGSWSVNGFSMNDLLEASEVIIGCTDNTACNYDLNATEPCTDCCLYTEDCAGECGGSAEDLGCGCNIEGPSGCDNVCGSILENDTCGECGGDNSTCTGCMDELACNFDETIIIENNQECEYPQQNFDCEGNCTVVVDCNNVCGGSAIEDECGICDGNNSTCSDCADVPNGDASEDMCGVCDNNPSNDCTQDCNDVWGGSGIVDACGICDGGSECSGQIVQGQCVNGEFNIGEFNVSGFDCSGWCLGTFSYSDDSCYDCEGTPDGDAWESDCGCVAADNTGDDCDDCDGIPNGDAIVDECGVCNGDGLSCLFGCNDVNATNYYCDVYGCEDEETPEGFLDDGSCTYDIEGTVIYFAPFFPQNYIENVTVILFAQTIDEFGQIIGEVYTDTTSTGVNGIFSFDEVSSNYDDYYFLFSYLESSDNYHNGINNTDALLIANVVVADTTFAYPIHSSIAADVNLDGRINSYDSSLIGRFMNDSSFSMNDLEVRWKFVSEIDTINDITNLTGNDNIIIHGIKLGDPNGSWE